MDFLDKYMLSSTKGFDLYLIQLLIILRLNKTYSYQLFVTNAISKICELDN